MITIAPTVAMMPVIAADHYFTSPITAFHCGAIPCRSLLTYIDHRSSPQQHLA
jgi:hypothetical protein